MQAGNRINPFRQNEFRILFYTLIAFNVVPNAIFETNGSADERSSITWRQQLRCGPRFCKSIRCEPLKKCAPEDIVLNASLCGCCSKCAIYRGENETCEDFKAPPNGQSHYKCKTGLECTNGTCTRTENETCETVAARRNVLKENEEFAGIVSKSLWIPDCDKKGKFEPKQCKKKKCLCYDEDGEKLFGQEERDLAQKMKCGCSRAMRQLQVKDGDGWMTKPQEHCLHTGDYKPLQCVNNICFCTNESTGEILGQVTKMAFREFLPCYGAEKTKIYESQCEIQMMRTRSLRYQFQQKNIAIAGLEHVRCDIDGTFAPKQCITDRCVCTDQKGTSIKSYQVETTTRDLIIGMTCNCARDEHFREQFHSHYSRMVCDSGGNFEPLQCYDDNDCYCVDEDGDVVTEALPPEKASNDFCRWFLLRLQIDIEFPIIITTDTTNTVTPDENSSDSSEYDDD